MDGNNSLNQLKTAVMPALIDVVRAIAENGRKAIGEKYQRSFFDVAKTPDYLKDIGLVGEKFTIPYGTISRHFGKDEDHELTEEEWQRISSAIMTPFAITRYYSDKSRRQQRGFRLYTDISKGTGYIVIGVDVKSVNQGKGKSVLLINSISTIFGKDGKLSSVEEEIYRSKKINPQQASLLERPNSSQYPFVGDSDCKDNTIFQNTSE